MKVTFTRVGPGGVALESGGKPGRGLVLVGASGTDLVGLSDRGLEFWGPIMRKVGVPPRRVMRFPVFVEGLWRAAQFSEVGARIESMGCSCAKGLLSAAFLGRTVVRHELEARMARSRKRRVALVEQAASAFCDTPLPPPARRSAAAIVFPPEVLHRARLAKRARTNVRQLRLVSGS